MHRKGRLWTGPQCKAFNLKKKKLLIPRQWWWWWWGEGIVFNSHYELHLELVDTAVKARWESKELILPFPQWWNDKSQKGFGNLKPALSTGPGQKFSLRLLFCLCSLNVQKYITTTITIIALALLCLCHCAKCFTLTLIISYRSTKGTLPTSISWMGTHKPICFHPLTA